MKHTVVAGALLAALPASLPAQHPQLKPPIAVYWMSVETSGGTGMAIPPGLGGMLPPGMQAGKRMKLDLGSSLSASGEPRAEHSIPAGLRMGASLPLTTPQIERAPGGGEPQSDGRFEQPKGRMLIYWGCGEAIRKGQPVVIDFAKLNSQDAAKAFRSREVSRPTGPAPGRNRTYGEWPNRQNSTAVPEQASLVGNHIVAGNYSPEVRFAVDGPHDFMAPVVFDGVRKSPAGAFLVKWQAIPTAIGYLATAAGQGESQADVVMWSSSETQEMGHALMDYLPPAEVQRLVKDKVVMPPQTTECAVPAGIFKSDGAMFNFIGYGNELNVVHPPRPSDPKQIWEQQYAVKVRLKSTGMTMLAEGNPGSSARSPPGDAPVQQPEERKPQRPADAVREGVNILRGILGR